MYMHKNTGRKLRLLEQRDGKALFADGESNVICSMAAVTLESKEVLRTLPIYSSLHYVRMIKPADRKIKEMTTYFTLPAITSLNNQVYSLLGELS